MILAIGFALTFLFGLLLGWGIQILESMGWRPLAAESHPRDGEQILVAGVETAALAKAPNGAHYAQFKKLGNRQVQLTQGSGGSLRVELDGTVLWIPQRFLLK